MDTTEDIAGLLSTVLELTLLVVFLMVISWIASRILGVRRGFWRAAATAGFGLVAANAIADLQFGESIGEVSELSDLLELGGLFVAYLLLSIMLASIIIDVLLAPRKGPRAPRPRPIKWLKSRLALLRRVAEIAMIARRRGLTLRSRSSFATPETAVALRKTLEDCGGIFVKFGQIASTREDMLPPVIIAELTKLQSGAPPLAPGVVAEILTAELGTRVDTEFLSIAEEPLAAASIGVTHRAVLADGTPAIVKVQRPGVSELVERDGRVLIWGARQLEARSSQARSLGLVALAEELVDGVTQELDYTHEATSNAQLRRNRADDEGIGIPKVYDSLTTSKVLVMAAANGTSIADRAAVAAAPVPSTVLADRLLESFLGQILKDGVYHADPHPGNILIDQDGTLWLIDYGAVGYLDPITLEALQLMALAYGTKDPAMLARAVRRMIGPTGADLKITSLEFDLGSVLLLAESEGFGPDSIQAILGVLRRHGIAAPRAMTILGRSMLTLEGTLRVLDGSYQMGTSAQRMLAARSSAVDSLREYGKTELIRAIPSLRTLPPVAEDLGYQARAGRFSMRVDLLADENEAILAGWLDRLLFVLIATTGLLASGVLLIGAALSESETLTVYLQVIGMAGLVLSSAMQMRAVAQILRRQARGP